MKPVNKLSLVLIKSEPTILFFSLRKIKRSNHVIKAFEIAKKRISLLKLEIAGGGKPQDLECIQKN